MKLIIDISEGDYAPFKFGKYTIVGGLRGNGKTLMSAIYRAVANATPLETHDEEIIKETVESIWGKPPCDDAISRKAVLDALKKCEPLIDYDEHDRRETYYEAEEVEFKISTLPPVYPQPKTGHWIPIRKSTGTIVAVKCECCGGSPRHGQKTDYCPNCGARMESEIRND